MTNVQLQRHAREIMVKGLKLKIVPSFKYLGAFVSEDGSKSEVCTRLRSLAKLKPVGEITALLQLYLPSKCMAKILA